MLLFSKFPLFTEEKQTMCRDWFRRVHEKIMDFGLRHGIDDFSVRQWQQSLDQLDSSNYLPDLETTRFGVDDQVTLYLRFEQAFGSEDPLEEIKPDFEVSWSIFGHCGPARCARYGNFMVEVSKFALEVERDTKQFITELRSSPLIDERKAQAEEERNARRRLVRKIEDADARAFFVTDLVPLFKDAPDKEIEVTLKGKKRKLALQTTPLARVEHVRGQPSRVFLNPQGIQYVRQIQEDDRRR